MSLWHRKQQPAQRPEHTRERLDALRNAMMASWEDSLVLGDGNVCNGIAFPMIAGLLAVAVEAQRVVDGETDMRRLKDALDSYVRDTDIERARKRMAEQP